MYDLSGKIALVTGVGGEHGIGRSIAMRPAEHGAALAIRDLTESPYADRRLNWAGLPQVADEIRALGRKSIGITADVTKSVKVENMVREGIEEFGRIDILVKNAGVPAGPDRVPVPSWMRRSGIRCNSSMSRGPISVAERLPDT